MKNIHKFYIDGSWVEPISSNTLAVTNPSTEEAIATIGIAGPEDVNRAVLAANLAFSDFSKSEFAERKRILQRILECYKDHYDEFAEIISEEMGAPITFAKNVHAATAVMHLEIILDVLNHYQFRVPHGASLVAKVPVGVCALITPWNFPVHQVMSKVAPALAAGCTMILKPSECSPISTHLLAKVMDEAGVPKGVFNLINGDGATTGSLLSSHPGIDVVSFTGSTGAGVAVAKSAAENITRPSLELGGKSANIVLADSAFKEHVALAVQGLMMNSGQNCMAPSRLLVPTDRVDEAASIAAEVCGNIKSGPAHDPETQLGPVVSKKQWEAIQGHIERGISDGAKLVCGGLGRPADLDTGYHVRPTVFSRVKNDMAIAREEVFGPVLAIIGYDSLEAAVDLANDSSYGLAAYVQSIDHGLACQLAERLRVGSVFINNPPFDLSAPIGGFKRSGYGREWGSFGLEEFLTTKALLGFSSPSEVVAK